MKIIVLILLTLLSTIVVWADDKVDKTFFFEGKLVTGAAVPVVTELENKTEILIQAQDQYLLLQQQGVEDVTCYLSGSASGDLVTERIGIKLNQLTCYNKDKSIYFDSKVKGFVLSDRDYGVPGELRASNLGYESTETSSVIFLKPGIEVEFIISQWEPF